MTRSEFVQTVFLSMFPLFLDEYLEYNECIGEKPKSIKDVYISAFDDAAEAADNAAYLIMRAESDNEDFWQK